MLGTLPKAISLNGTEYPIRSDYRDILNIIVAFNDDELTDREKVYVCLKCLYTAFETIPQALYEEAYRSAIRFIEGGIHEDTPSPRVLNWVKDEPLIFPAVNKAAGYEVRAVEYLHWWTFLGYFQSIDREALLGVVLTIRQKRTRCKQLEKYEKDFFNANRNLCALDDVEKQKKPEDILKALYNELLKGGAQSGK